MLTTVQRLTSVRNSSAVRPLIDEFIAGAGLQHYGLAYQRKTRGEETPRTDAILNFPAAWQRRYETLATASPASSDPVIRHITQSGIPTTWDCRGKVLFTSPDIARSAQALLGSAGEHGLKAGMTIPLSGASFNWGFLVVTTGDTSHADDLVTRLPAITFFAQVLFALISRWNAPDQFIARVLTSRQQEVLKWCAMGKTSWEIGQILHVSESTVEFHLAQAGKRLSTNGRRLTCLEALRQGLIDV